MLTRLTSLLALLVLAQALPLHAQAQLPTETMALVVGTVTDEDNGEVLIGANVVLLDERGRKTSMGTAADFDGHYELALPSGIHALQFSYAGYEVTTDTIEVMSGGRHVLDVELAASGMLDEVVVVGYGSRRSGLRMSSIGARVRSERAAAHAAPSPTASPRNYSYSEPSPAHAGEDYAHHDENRFLRPTETPLSTFGADVDRAAYANVRRFLNQGQLPPVDAVRTEELVNYFAYDYAAPTGADPVAFSNELGACPWAPTHQLLRIGVQARALDTEALPPSNLVFLLDVSGSMGQPDKLPLLKQSFRLLVEQLRPEDRVAILVYAGAAGVVLEPTAGSHKSAILRALRGLDAGGSTAGGAGIKLAYRLAREHFAEGGNNRVILATDGDFNVGTIGKESLEQLVERERESGVFLSVLGFGQGNYQEDRMQTLAEAGNGNAAYIDNLLEARKVLVEEFGGTLYTVAKDVKLQVEFNPAAVAAYRLIGYESRLLEAEDFNDDREDAGDMGSGHSVTALYEIVPVGVESAYVPKVDALKYQREPAPADAPGIATELATVRMKYKDPCKRRSADKIEVAVQVAPATESSADFRWASAVAAWSLLLQDSEYVGEGFDYGDVVSLAEGARGADARGYRAEAIRLMELSGSVGEPGLVKR